MPPSLHRRRPLFFFLAGYGLIVCSLLNRQSLWLDELIDLHQIRDFDLAGLLASVPHNAGGVPLSYLARFFSVHVLGYSSFSGRLPSLLFSLVACAGIYQLANTIRLRWPMMPVLIFAFAPCQLRYAMESRPYSQLLALTIWSTFVLLRLQANPRLMIVLTYTLISVAGMYTQPFFAFVPIAHLAWLTTAKRNTAQNRALVMAGGSLLIAALTFLPWYVWTVQLWRSSAAAQQTYAISLASARMIFKELLGAGYIGTAVIACLAWLGCQRVERSSLIPGRAFWGWLILLPLVLPVLADRYFGYFLATRQAIPVIAPLTLLAARGLEDLIWERRRAWAAVGLALMAVIFSVANFQFFNKPREDWQAAALSLQSAIGSGGCVIFTPSDSKAFFSFFAPQLAKRECAGGLPVNVAVARSPYGSQAAYQEARKRLRDNRYTQSKVIQDNGPTVEVYIRTRGIN